MSLPRQVPNAPLLQISLRTLLLTVAVLAVVFALLAWHVVGGLLICLAVAGTAATGVGIRSRRTGCTATGIVLLVCVLVAFLAASSAIAWVGSRTLKVHVVVIDSETLQPIPDADIEVLDGPPSLFDRPAKLSEFTTAISGLHTNDNGTCSFTHRFFAAGMEGTFRHSGYIDTGGVWIRASADGWGSVLIPLDRQTGNPRDIDDTSPLFVTISLSKSTISKTK